MYVAVKGGEAAIEASWRLLDAERRGDPALPALSVAQIRAQMRLAVDRVMSEGALYDPELAALALKQAQGDATEAVFLLRAYRTTLPRFGYAQPLDTAQIALKRRISATFKDVPGGQVLGPTYDYTQRLLEFSLLADAPPADAPPAAAPPDVHAAPPADGAVPATNASVPRVHDLLRDEGLIEPAAAPAAAAADDSGAPTDITREPLLFPADRATRLQVLARGDEGWLLALGYSTQRGYANGHPFAGEIRRGLVAVHVMADELVDGAADPACAMLDIGDIEITECQMINQFSGSRDVPPQFTVGYGLAFGGAERKAMAMALVDRALRATELGEPVVAPAQDEEFVLSHADSVEASGFVQHLKLPHYVDFQAELELVRRLRAEHAAASASTPAAVRHQEAA